MILTYSDAIETVNKIIGGYRSNKPLVIAIDGRSASGKTTFAENFGCPVIHTDDFFRPREKDGTLNISEYSGNFDIFRFKSEIIDNIKSGQIVKYGVFDCSVGTVTETVTVGKSNCYIIEGAYSLHPQLGEYAKLKIFFDIGEETQKKRIASRNGLDGLERFLRLWIPAEERYLNFYNIESQCDFTVRTEDCNG